jgi:hypothetical protein
MEIIIADIKDIMFDAKEAQARLEQYITDADRGINVTHAAQAEKEPKAKTIETLFYYLIEAKHDMDRVKDDMKELLQQAGEPSGSSGVRSCAQRCWPVMWLDASR